MQNDVLEQTKFMADYLKHVTTLSTGSFILLTLFLEKLFNRPHWRVLVIISIGGFALSLVASVLAFIGLLHWLPSLEGDINFGSKLWTHGGVFTGLGFLIGVSALMLFAIGNWSMSMRESENERPRPN